MKPPDLTSQVAPKKILFATDFSSASKAVLPYAVSLAAHYGSNLYFAHVIALKYPDFPPPEERVTKLEQAREFTEQELERLLEAALQKGISCQPLVGEGAVWDVLSDMIHENSIDLVIVGTHGRRGLKKLLLGSVAEEVFRMAPCPVLTVGPKISETSSMDVQLVHILYPVEFAPDTNCAAAYAISLAEEYGAKLTFMKVLEETVASPELKAQIQEPVTHWMDDHVPSGSVLRERTSFELGFGRAPEAIVAFARDRGVDLIVMGMRHLDPVLAGHLPETDTAYEVVRTAPCPVLTVR
ncbi:MAG TPA: universal stress protein [Terriglobia bacterium]|nr:universal stress protein [Terriglobia bacterium]